VVADEARKPAGRTGNATKEIAEMIEPIQLETKIAVTAMPEGTKEVDLGVARATLAGSSLQDIIRMSEQVGDMIAQIDTAANQQSATGSIERIATIRAGTAAGAQQRTEALGDLSALASGLRRLVGQIRLEAESSDGETGQNPSLTRSAHA